MNAIEIDRVSHAVMRKVGSVEVPSKQHKFVLEGIRLRSVSCCNAIVFTFDAIDELTPCRSATSGSIGTSWLDLESCRLSLSSVSAG